MIKLNHKESLFKALNIIVLNSILLQQFSPMLYASGMEREQHFFQTSNSSSKKTVPKALNTGANPVHELLTKNVSINSSGSGAGQPEISGSTANLGGDIVSEFTGDMNYSIPLMDVDGFPLVLSYNPNITMDQEASWVGLGWNLSLGSIERDMRGIPDDFNGDQVEQIIKSKPLTVEGKNHMVDIYGGFGNPTALLKSGTETKPGGSVEVSAYAMLNLNAGANYSWGKYENNYTGIGKTRSFGINGSIGFSLSAQFGPFELGQSAAVSGGLGISTDSQNGIGISSNKGFSKGSSFSASGSGLSNDYSEQHSTSVNSRSGIKIKSDNYSTEKGIKSYIDASVTSSIGSYRTYGVQSFVPKFVSDYNSTSYAYIDKLNLSFQYYVAHVGAGFGTENYESEGENTHVINSYPAYGYQNYTKGSQNNKAMLDFNRDNNASISSDTKLLSFSAPTYDTYFCSAPGLVTSFRPYRYDVVEYHDPVAQNIGSSETTTYETAMNGGVNIVGNVTAGVTDSKQITNGTTTGVTSKGTIGTNLFKGVAGNTTFNDQEYYLKTQGETKENDLTLYNSFQGDLPAAVAIQQTNGVISMTGAFTNGQLIPSVNSSQKRTPNTIHYRQIPIGEMAEPRVVTSQSCPGEKSTDKNGFFTEAKQAHHTGAVEVVGGDGMRYMFGIPVYSYTKSDVSFAAAGRLVSSDYNRTGLLSYAVGDNSVNNSLGRANYFDKTTLPGYSSSFLLTDMFTSDYIDRTGNGSTPDDQGNYYRVNYTSPYNATESGAGVWKWRFPMCSDVTTPGLGMEYGPRVAYAGKNSHSDKWDDTGSYTYGEKDVWYAASVESKSLIAFFCFGNREDQFSMKGEDGGLDLNKPGSYLQKIMLYSKNDYEVNGSNAKPLQVVEFEYDYSLCKGYVGNKNAYSYLPGNPNYVKTGKLTLKKIRTYSGKSGEGKTNPIVFEYSSNNPDFAFNSSDRWGNYKPNSVAKPNFEFPYSEQDLTVSEQTILAWKLTAASVVGGQRSEFTYESDNYAFVQDKRAMRMFNIAGMSSTDELNNQSGVVSNPAQFISAFPNSKNFRNPTHIKDHYNVIYFKLEKPLTSGSLSFSDQIKKLYLEDEQGHIPDYIYFKTYSKLDELGSNETENSNLDKGYEFVESQVQLGKKFENGNFCGVLGSPNTSGEYTYGYFIVEPVDISVYGDRKSDEFDENYDDEIDATGGGLFSGAISQKVNPLQIANWQYARLNTPCIVYGGIDYSATQATDYCDYDLGNDGNVFGKNFYKMLNRKDFGVRFEPTKSLVRLYEPDNIKVGGGVRIAAITTYDNWDQYSGEYNTHYTKNYSYGDLKVPQTFGVASYEPQIGNNENPFYQFEAYDSKRYTLPDEKVYQKNPWGELVFPSAEVGYSTVTTTLFDGTDIGKSVSEFYTLKDKPTITKRTEIARIDKSGDNAISLSDGVKEVFGFSQGFYVETSDFHGKPKKSSVLDNLGNLISSSEIEYYDNKTEYLNYIQPNGKVIQSQTPSDVDMYLDSWKTSNQVSMVTTGKTGGLGITMIGVIPFPIINYNEDEGVFNYSVESTGYTFNKVVHNYAIAKSVTTNTYGSKNTARNLYFDEKSGAVIVSSLQDEYNDLLYSMSYPAHWYYPNFKNMSETDGMIIRTGIFDVGSGAVVSDKQLYEGDHLLIRNGSNVIEAWVLAIERIPWLELECGRESYLLINQDGTNLTGVTWSTATVEVERTGVKNNVEESMYSLTTKHFPTQSGTNFVFPSANILNSSAVTFKENKNIPCIPFYDSNHPENYPTTQLLPLDVINPYLQGTKGNFRLESGFSIQQERDESNVNTVRENGVLTNYEPFYALTNCGWKKINETGHPNFAALDDYKYWRTTGQVDVYDEFGKPLDSFDELKISQAVIYGLNNDLKLVPKASVFNAKSNEIGFDGFEDLAFYLNDGLDYVNYGFSLKPITTIATLANTVRHSGTYSLKVNGTATYTFPVYTVVSGEENIEDGEYQVKECNCIQGYNPIVGNTYWLSTWVHENTRTVPFANSAVRVEMLNSSNVVIGTAIVSTPSGPVLDGWQKIEGQFTVSAGTSFVRYSLVGSQSYFDDFRTHPIKSNMSTTVYDQNTLLPLATQDNYNFTTFYNYDENYNLVRIRVETIEGIVTISESETGNYRNH